MMLTVFEIVAYELLRAFCSLCFQAEEILQTALDAKTEKPMIKGLKLFSLPSAHILLLLYWGAREDTVDQWRWHKLELLLNAVRFHTVLMVYWRDSCDIDEASQPANILSM